ncbi:sensor histidine kinase [Nocardia thailandica]|uniref:histidine kinase n=1 Tax=Nocardia thailandica TaxID=257275 RepID=A0ABW6PKN2_9NOCA
MLVSARLLSGSAATGPPGRSPVRLPARRDAAVAVAAVAVDVLVFSDVLAPLPAGLHTSAVGLAAWAAVGALVLAWRSIAPPLVLALVCAHSAVAALSLSYRPMLEVCVALTAVVAVCRRSVGVVGTAAVALVALTWVAGEVRSSAAVLRPAQLTVLWGFYLIVVGVAVGAGLWRRRGERRSDELARRGAEEARLAVLAERRRMARELHDIIGSTVTVMMLQAAGARRVMALDPARADRALAAVDELGVQAMGELHRLLGLLRTADPAGSPAVDLPGLADLDALVASLRATGLRITVTEHGPRERLDPSVDLTLYRVVQEALTNVAKHAGPGARAHVELAWAPARLTASVTDDGRGRGPAAPRTTGGRGLVGLSERVVIVGGAVESGPCPGGGFRVAATLPCGSPRG